METDLRDALIAWQGGELPPGRADELLAKLRSDADFRRAFADEAWTLSLTRVAQAPAPRWLALHEELGLNAAVQDAKDDRRRQNLLTAIRREPIRFVNVWWRRAAYGAMAAAAALVFTFLFLEFRAPTSGVKAQMLAILVQSDKAVWKNKEPAHFADGSALSAERLQLVSGRASLMFTSGVTMDFEGPADLDLLSADRVLCREGRLRTKVPHGAEGFCVETPRGTVTDLGTELGVSVSRDGKTNVAVFEGQAEVSLPISGQQGVRTALLTAGESTELIPATGEIHAVNRDDFLDASKLHLPPLSLAPHYADSILAAKPLHYWHLDREQDGSIPDEVSHGPSLRLAGGTSIKPDEAGRSSVYFPGSSAPGAVYLDSALTKLAPSCAIELWFAAESTRQMSLVALTAAETHRKHLLLVETGNRRPGHDTEAGIVRYLTRWPAGARGGMNIYSPPAAFPFQWHHLVAQQSNGDLQLFIDGKLVGTAHADSFPSTVSCALQFGGLEFTGGNPAKIDRPFAGRLAEVALYDRVLTEDEIRHHAAMRTRQ